jgi:hypothetical protein
MEELIEITDCPASGLQRKVDYDFTWSRRRKSIVIDCRIFFFKNGEKVAREGINYYDKPLIASDSLINPANGELLNQTQINNYFNALRAKAEYNLRLNLFQQQLVSYNQIITNWSNIMDGYQAQLIEFQNYPENFRVPPFEPIQPIEPTFNEVDPGDAPGYIKEYDYYVYVIGAGEINLPNTIKYIIHKRDLEGKFNI